MRQTIARLRRRLLQWLERSSGPARLGARAACPAMTHNEHFVATLNDAQRLAVLGAIIGRNRPIPLPIVAE